MILRSQNPACSWNIHAYLYTFSERDKNTSPFGTSCQILLFLESCQSNHAVVKTHKPHPQIWHTRVYEIHFCRCFGPQLHFGYHEMQRLILRNPSYFALLPLMLWTYFAQQHFTMNSDSRGENEKSPIPELFN